MRLSLLFAACMGVAVLTLSGCAGTPVSDDWHGAGQKSLCLVDNPSVRPQAFLTLRRALMDKGLKVIRVKSMIRKRFYPARKRFVTKLSTAHPGVIHLFVMPSWN